MMRRMWEGVRFVASTVLIAGVHFYQVCLRPMLPAVCRFEPSCSEYFIQAVNKYGPLRGACKGAWRICRCNPFSQGGFDPP
ncbi:MAG TPA: membrane protein insertion efficiency factor YidD [Gemmataceae bacterium]|nr:membrane protein insertion efficiency factor YidD [Gemmataceae bacterium]